MDPTELTQLVHWMSDQAMTSGAAGSSSSSGGQSVVDVTHHLATTNTNVISSLLSTMISAIAQQAWDQLDPNHYQEYLGPYFDKYYSYTPEQLKHLTREQSLELDRLIPLQAWRDIFQSEPGHERELKMVQRLIEETQKFNLQNTISFRPSKEALQALGVDKQNSNEVFRQAAEFLHRKGEALEWSHKDLIEPLDASKIIHGGDAFLPGQTPTRSLLAPHVEETVHPDSPEGFVARMRGAGTILPVIDKLPFVAFYYALVEFFFLRPNVDLYKEEVEDDPAGVTAETVSDIAVRVGILFVIAMVTLTFA